MAAFLLFLILLAIIVFLENLALRGLTLLAGKSTTLAVLFLLAVVLLAAVLLLLILTSRSRRRKWAPGPNAYWRTMEGMSVLPLDPSLLSLAVQLRVLQLLEAMMGKNTLMLPGWYYPDHREPEEPEGVEAPEVPVPGWKDWEEWW